MKIAVIGQGVSGLTTALSLLEKFPGIRLTIFGDRKFEDITSYGPAGHFEIINESHREWGKVSFKKFARLEREYGSSIGVKYVSGQFITFDKKELEDLEKRNKGIVHNFRHLEEEELSDLYPFPVPFGAHFSTYSAEGKLYVPWLKNQCEKHGATFVLREIHSFDELVDEGFDVIINCSGLKGGKLSGDDDSVYPVRGVLLEIDAPGFKHFSLIGMGTFILTLDHSILVGTVRQPNRYDRNVTEDDRKEILNKIYKIHPNLKNHKILNEWCGLRPYRPTVRVERQTRVLEKSGKEYNVIHNYGHGSNGFTLSWGTASDVVELFENIMKDKKIVYSKL